MASTVWNHFLQSSLDALRLLWSFGLSARETLAIVWHEEQFNAVLKGLDEVQKGEVVSLQEAFQDLNTP